MNEKLEIKRVPFLGTELVAARDADRQIWAGVRWMCDGIGLNENQARNERKKIQSDKVLLKGGSNLTLPTNGGPQEALCLKLDFVPLWLAKISVTPAMETETPELADRLVQYQLRAKDVLAAAFLPEAVTSVAPAPPVTPPTVTPPFGELSRFLAQITRVMRENNQPPEVIADTVKSVCAQGGVTLPPNFVRQPRFQQVTFTGVFWR